MDETRADSTIPPMTTFRAGVFDLDGVVTQTAGLHAASWKQLFDDYLRQRAERDNAPFRPFDIDRDYRRYVDGRPRYDGVRSFLASRNIQLPAGTPDDPPDAETICGLGNRKNEIFNQRLKQQGVDVYDSSVAVIRQLRQAGLRTALVSSSKNAGPVLAVAGLEDLFDVRVDGIEAARLQLKGKPDPDIFLHAAKALGVAPQQAFAVEDALSGVSSARAAGYALVVGIDRADSAAALREHGAHVTVRDLNELPMTDTTPTLPDALEHFPDIERQLSGTRPAVFLDYDGTLTPIVARPELAVLSDDMRAAIRALAELCTVAIVSGRDRANVEQLVGIDTLVYAGSHGFDIAGPGGLRKQHEQAADFLPALDRAEALLGERLAGIDGALVDRKRFALAAHYRLVAEDRLPEVEAAVDAALAEAKGQLRKTGGKKIFELRPNLPWDKGRAVDWLLEALELDRSGVLPFYIGDDETDEDAFKALRQSGIGVLVTAEPQQTAAHYRLHDPEAVGRFLRAITGAITP